MTTNMSWPSRVNLELYQVEIKMIEAARVTKLPQNMTTSRILVLRRICMVLTRKSGKTMRIISARKSTENS